MRTINLQAIYGFGLNIILMLCSSLYSVKGYAQLSAPNALNIGDHIPDALMEQQFEVVGNPEKKHIRLRDYRDKLLIIDFWATWCGSCLATFPKLDSIQHKYSDRVAIVLSTQQDHATASTFLNKRDWRLTSIVNGELLNGFFPHRFIPHCIWIKDGTVQAITGSDELTEEHILRVMAHDSVVIKEKKDLPKDPFQPIAEYAAIQSIPIHFQSTLTGYIDGTGGSGQRKREGVWVYYQMNRPIIELYKTALKISFNQLVLEMEDPYSLLNPSFDPESLYCYQLFVPPNSEEKKVQAFIVDDLNNHFRLCGRWEKRNVPCLIIVSKENSVEPLISDEGISVDSFVKKLNYASSVEDSGLHFINESGYSGKIRHTGIPLLKKNRSELEELLELYGLSLVEAVRTVDLFVLSRPQ